MRDRHITKIARGLPRMSWTPKNLYNLEQRTADRRSEKFMQIDFKRSAESIFQQRWTSKAVVRAYHGDHINEKLFKRWYLPGTLPDVRPRKKVFGDDDGALQDFAKRRQREKESAADEEEMRVGLAPVGSLMFAEVERRLDVLIFRSCFAHSVYDARRLVVHGKVLLNGKRHYNANTRLAPGDMFAVKPSEIRFLRPQKEAGESDNVTDHPDAPAGLTPFNLPFWASPWLFVPAYLEVSYATCAAVYVRHPTARPQYSEIPTPYDADGEVLRHAWEWYMRHRPRVRTESQWAKSPDDRLRKQMEELRLGRNSLRFATSF
ncbi:alpha-L RNA-binding motif-containing protein [Mycena rosella]|uniref:Alpha-L RNA-binding motif-containing protein n=1 Tax=Mycena rosella TaxID=1033263 RepID=A0AAD7GU54_MYCRO|nr:alpha-L RNA-binding motif-containing protein [Mycena rosella]